MRSKIVYSERIQKDEPRIVRKVFSFSLDPGLVALIKSQPPERQSLSSKIEALLGKGLRCALEHGGPKNILELKKLIDLLENGNSIQWDK